MRSILHTLIILFIILTGHLNSCAQDFNKNFADSLDPLYETKLLRLGMICVENNDSIRFLQVTNKYLSKYTDKNALDNFLFNYKIYTYHVKKWQNLKQIAISAFLKNYIYGSDTALYIKLMLIESEDQNTRMDALLKKALIDTCNIRHMKTIKEIIKDKRDSRKFVTKEGMTAMFLVLQHVHDKQTRNSYMDTILKWVKRHDIDSSEYALYVDRNLINDGKPQLYGSQYYERDKGTIIIYPIGNKGKLDERRANAKLPTMKQYIDFIEMVEHKKVIFSK